MNHQKPGMKRVVRDFSYKEWIAQPDHFATREGVVAFHNCALEEQILPLIRNEIRRYHLYVQAHCWYRRLGRWFVGLVRRSPIAMTPEQAREVLANYPREDGEPEESVAGTIPATGEPRDNGEVRRSCVTCGSRQLEPVNERGGLRCHNGHVIEEPPLPGGPP